jgi:cell wall assembly regulator SMI1
LTFELLADRLRATPGCEIAGGVPDAAIRDAERRLAVEFPEGLRDYLRVLGQLSIGGDEFFGLGPAVPRNLDITQMTLAERHEFHPHIPVGLVPLFNDGSGSHYCIVVADGPANGNVVYWDHELGEGQIPDTVSHDLTAWLEERVRMHSGERDA